MIREVFDSIRLRFLVWAITSSNRTTVFPAAILLPLATTIALESASAATVAIVGAVASGLGTFLDSKVILPNLTRGNDIEGPRVADVRVQFAEEGAPIHWGFGDTVRTPGAIIWASNITEVPVTTSQGGGKGGFGGGGGGSVTQFEAYADVAILIASTKGTEIDSLYELVAGAKPIYRADPLVSFSGTATATATRFIAAQSMWSITAASLELGDFVAGGTANVSGWSNGGNNGSFDIVSASADAGGPSSTVVLRNPNGVSEGPTGSISITQDVSDYSARLLEDVEIITGAITQSPSSVIEETEGAGNVPGWPGWAIVVLKRLFLGEFGNGIPNFGAIWKPGTTAEAGAMISAYLARAQIDPDFLADLDVTDADVPIKGFTTLGATDANQAIQPLQIAANLLAQTNGAGLRFFRRTNARIIDVDPEDLSCRAIGGEQMRRPVEVVDGPELSRPEASVVRYIDHEARYQNGAQSERSNTKGTPGTTLEVNLANVVLTGAGVEARQIARRVLYDSYIGDRRVRVSLPMAYAHVQENDLLRIPVTDFGDDVVYLILVDKIDRGANYVIEAEGTVEVQAALDQTGVAESPLGTDIGFEPEIEPVVGVIGDPVNHPIPAPSPVPMGGNPTANGPGGVTAGGFRPAGGTTGRGFRPTTVHGKRADEDDSLFRILGVLNTEAYGGYAVGALAGTGIDARFRDDVSTVDVQFYHGSASSTDDAGLLSGSRTILLGQEIVSFKTATMVSQGRWTLSGLLRGRLGTEQFIGSHAADEPALMLTGPGLEAFPIPSSWIGSDVEFRFVPPGKTIDDAESLALTITYAGVRPLAPTNVVANRTDTNAIDLSWFRRSRTPSPTFGPGAAPVTETVEHYEVDVIEDGTGDVLATLSPAEGVTSLSITAAEMTALGIALADAFSVIVYQTNPLLGSGNRGDASEEITIAGIGS